MGVFLSLYHNNWIILSMWERTFSHHPSFPQTGVHIWEREAFGGSRGAMAVRWAVWAPAQTGPDWLLPSPRKNLRSQNNCHHPAGRVAVTRVGLEKHRLDPEKASDVAA